MNTAEVLETQRQSVQFVSWVGGMGYRSLAIVFTDIIDSTSLNERYGDEQWGHICVAHFEKAATLVAKHRGFVVKTIGDAVMAVFHDSVSALNFAIELEENPGNDAVNIRAGVHIGVVRVTEGDTFGNEVNTAARVASKAKLGGVWVSDRVHGDWIRRDPSAELPWVHQGLEPLDGQSTPLSLWAIPPARDQPPRVVSSEASLQSRSSRASAHAAPATTFGSARPRLSGGPNTRLRVTDIFHTSLPAVGQSEYELSEKLVLFGGRPKDLTLGFNAIKHSVARYTFDREIVASVHRAITESDAQFQSFTISSLPGGGLSIALAQLARDLSAAPHTKVFWVIDDPDGTRRALSLLSSELADSLYLELTSQSPLVEKAVIVLDDVSKTPSDVIRNLLSFRERCKQISSKRNGPRMTFVFGSVGAARTLSEDATFQLVLTRSDQQRCYDEMSNVIPKVLCGVDGGLEAILNDHPEARWYNNDAQAFIDFLMEHGEPTTQANGQWLARTDGLTPNELDIFAKTAVAQLIGLHVEERVVARRFNSLARQGFQDVEQLVHQISGLAVIQDAWKGLGLSCGRRARSILERTNRFTPEYIEETLSEFLEAALEQVQKDGHRASPTLEFARHIFQRLGKNALYRFPNKIRIAQNLLQRHVDALRAALSDWSAADKARWAGTLSAVISPAKGKEPLDGAFVMKTADLLCKLCGDALSAVRHDVGSVRPEVALSFYRAGRRLLLLAQPSAPNVRAVCTAIQEAITDELFWRILKQGFESDGGNSAYRSNELIHARARFEDCLQGPNKFTYYGRMTVWYEAVDTLFMENGLALDAGNWLKRSEYVWFPSRGNPEDQRRSLAKRADYLKHAQNSVKEFPTWAEHVSRTVKRFVLRNPSFGDMLGVASKGSS